MAFDPFFLKHAINPKSVETSLLDDDEWKTSPVLNCLSSKLRKAIQ